MKQWFLLYRLKKQAQTGSVTAQGDKASKSQYLNKSRDTSKGHVL